MQTYRILKAASYRIDEIYGYSWDQWGEEQARRYISGLFECFDEIAKREVLWRAIPAEYDVTGYYTSYEKHFVYWRELSDGSVGIATVLHQSMSIRERLQDDL